MDYNKLTVAQLKVKLGESGLSTTGKKDELIKRLTEHEQSIEAVELKEEASADKLEEQKVETALPTKLTPINEEEKRKYRAERFGIPPSLEEKKKIRMDRFKPASPLSPQEALKLEQRKQRFGIISPILAEQEAIKKKQQRAERFTLNK